MGSLERRARNEAMFRAVNDKIKDLNDAFETFTGDPTGFICECDDITCTEQVRISLEDFERVHATPNRFLVKPGHEDRGPVEHVVERHDEFAVVEKPADVMPG